MPGTPSLGLRAAPSALTGLLLATTLESLGFGGPLGEALVAAVGGDETTAVTDFVSMPEGDLVQVLETLVVEGVPVTGVGRGRAVRAIRAVFDVAKLPMPSLGAALPVAPPSRPAATPAEPSTPAVGDKRRVADFLDQGGEGSFSILSKEAITEARQRYVQVTGGPPSLAARPTEEQLSGIYAKIGKSAPYVDFAVFGPHGRRAAKARKFAAQAFVDGELVTRMLTGP